MSCRNTNDLMFNVPVGYLTGEYDFEEVYCSEDDEIYSLGIVNVVPLSTTYMNFTWNYYGEPKDEDVNVRIR